MGLDVYLNGGTGPSKQGSGIFVRREGRTLEITREEWDALHPGSEPCVAPPPDPKDERKFHAHTTHNLIDMAVEAGLYKPLWRPHENGLFQAIQLVVPLTTGLQALVDEPERFQKLNPPSGWGNYDGFVQFVREYLEACRANPEARVSASV